MLLQYLIGLSAIQGDCAVFEQRANIQKVFAEQKKQNRV